MAIWQFPYSKMALATKSDIATIINLINVLQKGINQMAFDLTALKNAAQQETTVEQSAIALLQNLTSQLQTLIANSGNSVNPADIQAIVNQLNNNATTLASAVTANTPATPPTPPPPPAP